MNAPFRSLQLEPLETRTLLAGAAPEFAADFELAASALSGTGAYEASFSINFGNSQLVLSGQESDSLTIDLDRLPAFVTNLRISSFSTVTFTGTDRVDNVVVTDVDSLSAPNLSVTKSLHLNDVGSVDFASAGALAVLKGSSTEFSVKSLSETIVISDLQSTLTINSQSQALFVVALNSDQTLNLKYRPESVTLAGLPPSSVHFIDDSAGPGNGQTDDGSSDNSTSGPPPEPDPVEVITVPLDERTRAFIEELRALLHTSPAGSRQLVFDFMAQATLTSSQVEGPPPVQGPAPLWDSMPIDWDLLARSLGASHDIQGDVGESRMLADVSTAGRTPIPDRIEDVQLDTGPAGLPAAYFSPLRMQIDATWPVAVAPSESPDDAGSLPGDAVGEYAPVEIRLEDRIRAFGSFLAERVSAEYSAGGQSFILLVDPKPSRPSGTGATPTSALDLFARENRTTLSSLQQAMR